MAKANFTDEDDALLTELGVEIEVKNTKSHTPREERIIAGFEDIERFFEQHGRVPMHGEDRDIFERLYAVRLDKIRSSSECRPVLANRDKHGLLTGEPAVVVHEQDELDDDALLAELGVLDKSSDDITKLTHVKSRADIKTAEEIAKRTPCPDFDTFKSLFARVKEELASGARVTRKFKDDAQIRQEDFFILGGQKVYVAETGEEFIADYGRSDCRLRVIYDNGTESDILMRSLQRALNKDETSRRIIKPVTGTLFSDVIEEGDTEAGTIYVLRSKSDHPLIQEYRNIIHKIGVTSGTIEKRIINAKLDPTFLMAEVEIVASYVLSNINQIKLESVIHRFFEPAKLNIEIRDRFGNPVVPREWFLVPLYIIDEVIEKIRDGTIVNFRYDPNLGKIKQTPE